MAFLKLLTALGLIFIAATVFPVNGDSTNSSAVDYRLPDNVVPVHYNIRLAPYIEEDNFTFDGEISASFLIHRASQDLSLHALELTINEAATSLVDCDGVSRTPVAHNYDNTTEILVLTFDDELPPGHYTINMKFVGILNDDLAGFFRSSYENDKGDNIWLAATHFESTSARRAFPCWDEPALKATFNISIKHQRNYTALSNMPMLEQTDNEDGTVWSHFDTTPVMSTYLVAFVVSDYVRVSNADGTVNMWCPSHMVPHVTLAHKVAQISGQLLTRYTNSTDKVPKMDHVVVEEFNAGAMENWGLIIYHKTYFAYDEEVDTTASKHRVAKTATHEMAHQWFGNVVSPLWWSYVWLNEGFASFFEKYILNEIFKDWRMMDLFVVTTQHSAFHIDVAKNVMPITSEVNSPEEIESLFSFSSYGKAPAILRMLQHTITDDVFRKGLIKYLHAHQFSSATPDDLWNALQEALDESDIPHDDYKLKEVMKTWIEQRHYPVVHVTRNYDTGEVTVRQEHFRPHAVREGQKIEVDDDKWWVPLTFTTQSNCDFFNTLPTHWLSPQDENITIGMVDPNDWIIVNLQQMGYYLVNYDPTNWQKLADYLNSDDYAKIHTLNRAQIVNDAFQLLIVKQLNISIFLDIASYLSNETDYLPWYPMFNIFKTLEYLFYFPGTEFLKSSIIQMLNGLINNIGYEENITDDDYTKLKRIDALKWACHFGHSECRRMAKIKLSQHLADPETHKVPPNLKEWVYCDGMIEANASTWNNMLDVYLKNPTDRTILNYLACCENHDVLISFLNATDNLKLQDKDYQKIYMHIILNHADNLLILDHILANLEKVNWREVDKMDVLKALIFSVHYTDQLDKINEFSKNNCNEKEMATIQSLIKLHMSLLKSFYFTFAKTIQGDEK